MNFNLSLFGIGFLLVLVQAVAALPWLVAFNREGIRAAGVGSPNTPKGGIQALLFSLLGGQSLVWLVVFLGLVVVAGLLGPLLLAVIQDTGKLESLGRLYGSLLHLQLGLDLFVLILGVLLLTWPKGGAVALAAFREGLRQPMFWLMAGLAVLIMVFSPFIPYFTFGEDHKMVEELGYDIIMLAAVLFGCLTASMSIAEEIEGRTAITLMSKPVSRRQFLLGKFLGIFLTAVFMTVLLGWMFVWLIEYKEWYDRVERYDMTNTTGVLAIPVGLSEFLQGWVPDGEARDFVQGIGLWVYGAADTFPGLILGLCKVMVLLAIAVSLSTRLPMVANIVSCLVVYLLGHLTPVLIHIAQQRFQLDSAGTVGQMLVFMAQLFEVLLPGLDLLGVGTAVVSDAPPEPLAYLWYVGSVVLYALMYTAIALLFGLILFEDRDLA